MSALDDADLAVRRSAQMTDVAEVTWANAAATLALAEEMRTANLLAALRDNVITDRRAMAARAHIIASFDLDA